MVLSQMEHMTTKATGETGQGAEGPLPCRVASLTLLVVRTKLSRRIQAPTCRQTHTIILSATRTSSSPHPLRSRLLSPTMHPRPHQRLRYRLEHPTRPGLDSSRSFRTRPICVRPTSSRIVTITVSPWPLLALITRHRLPHATPSPVCGRRHGPIVTATKCGCLRTNLKRR